MSHHTGEWLASNLHRKHLREHHEWKATLLRLYASWRRLPDIPHCICGQYCSAAVWRHERHSVLQIWDDVLHPWRIWYYGRFTTGVHPVFLWTEWRPTRTHQKEVQIALLEANRLEIEKDCTSLIGWKPQNNIGQTTLRNELTISWPDLILILEGIPSRGCVIGQSCPLYVTYELHIHTNIHMNLENYIPVYYIIYYRFQHLKSNFVPW